MKLSASTVSSSDDVQGQEILVLEDQFPSNVYPWREKARESGGRVVTVPRPAPTSRENVPAAWTPLILAAIGPRTAVVTLPHCHWTEGSLIDLVAVGKKARREGAARGPLLIGPHFGSRGAGRVRANGDAWRLDRVPAD